MNRTIVTIFGSGLCEPETTAYRHAHDLGAAIARAGWTICNGGYGGTMEAAARGAVEAGGHTIGVTCQIFGRRGPNAFIRQDVPTFDLMTRLDTLVRLGRAYVVLPGGTGTLVELALVWELLNKSLLRRRAPLILFGECWSPVVDVIAREQPGSLRPTIASSAQEVVAAIGAGLNTKDAAGAEQDG